VAESTVAIIVPVRNEARLLLPLIDRLQHLNSDELILVDGGSTDATCEMLARSGLNWIASKPGRAVQMNAGAAICDSDILLFIHADTVVDSSHISKLREVMRDADVVGGRFDVRLSGRSPLFRVIACFINWRSRLTRISTGDQCLFVRRSVFENMGGFADQPLMEDVEFSKRLKRLGRVVCLRETVTTSSRRWEHYGVFRTIALMWKLRLLYWLGVSPDKLARIYRDAR